MSGEKGRWRRVRYSEAAGQLIKVSLPTKLLLHRTLIPFWAPDQAVSIPLRQKLWIFADPDTLRPSGESVEWIGGQGDVPCCAIA